jgi:hypothetical protein
MGKSFAQGLLSVDVPSLSVKDKRRQARGRGGDDFALIEQIDKENFRLIDQTKNGAVL